MSYYTYLLRCADGSLYAGITTDPARRFSEHAGKGKKGAKYTALRRPLRFEAVWASGGRSEASRLESRLKALTKAEKEGLLRGETPESLNLSAYITIKITETGRFCTMLFVCYPKCTTCQKAKALLGSRGLNFEVRDIKEEKPTEAELRLWHKKSGLSLKRFFNTSGQKYKELALKDRLPAMSEDEQLALLATDGMLVKRPILVKEDLVLVGFRPDEWEAAL